ncbi:hypothetical protein CapIbe_015049 [Capra ibex]
MDVDTTTEHLIISEDLRTVRRGFTSSRRSRDLRGSPHHLRPALPAVHLRRHSWRRRRVRQRGPGRRPRDSAPARGDAADCGRGFWASFLRIYRVRLGAGGPRRIRAKASDTDRRGAGENSRVRVAVSGRPRLLPAWRKSAAENYRTVHESLTQIA